MSPKYKLTYFKTKGRAEPIRLLLAYGNQEFEDNFIDKDQWPQVKETMPFGKVPILEIDGKVYHQSVAIRRYLAKKFGLAGSSDEESLEIDMIVDTFADCSAGMKKYMQIQDETEKAAEKKKFVSETLPYYASKFDNIVKANGGYFVNGKLSWADIYFVVAAENMVEDRGIDELEKYPNLRLLKEKVFGEPNIKAWLSRRVPLK